MNSPLNAVEREQSGSSGSPVEQMDIVVVGHVDHGKSTVIGRLMADTGSLPEGKLEQVKAMCERNARPFEYAFLLDALKSEQAQGITIDTARCFFKTAKRRYIIHDAPGHIEFLKNMVTGAARAEAALLVIDAHEGIQENSRRHGYILSMLGLRQVAVLVNKMDLVNYGCAVFERIREEYTEFLKGLGVNPLRFIPVSARDGVNISTRSPEMEWYDGPAVLKQVDEFVKFTGDADRPFRMPVQDIYKFTADGDDRRIIAGTVETGSLCVGDEVVFLPSGKSSTVKSIEAFAAAAPDKIRAGQAVGFTLDKQIYVKGGELAVRADESLSRTGVRFRANIFWMAHGPMVAEKRYKLKIGAARVPVELVEIRNILDASELSSLKGKGQIDRHDVGECVLETTRPVAFDLSKEIEKTARFVIVDNYEIVGCGIVLEQIEGGGSLLAERVRQREIAWEKGYVTSRERAARYRHKGKFVVFVGSNDVGTSELAKKLELKLFLSKPHAYYLSLSNVFELGTAEESGPLTREEHIYRLGEMARVITDAGLLFITALDDVDGYDIKKLKLLNEPNELFVVCVGDVNLGDFRPRVKLEANPSVREAIDLVVTKLCAEGVIPDYQI